MKRLGRLSIAIALFVAGSLTLTRAAHAFTHLVLPGETLAQIASRVYGDPKLEYVLAGANALDVTGGSAIVPGMRLEIPAPAYHHVMQNETWYELALAWLGDTKRADALANANKAQSWVPPEEGREIVVPAVVAVIANDNDNDMTIASKYLGDVNKAWVVDAYNFRKTGPFRRGEVVLIALPDLTLTVRGKAEARDALDRERTEGQQGCGTTSSGAPKWSLPRALGRRARWAVRGRGRARQSGPRAGGADATAAGDDPPRPARSLRRARRAGARGRSLHRLAGERSDRAD